MNLQLSRFSPNQQVLHLRFSKRPRNKKYVERAAHINLSVCTRVSLLLVFETWRLEFTYLFNKYRSVVVWSGDSRSCYRYQVRRLVCSTATAKQKRSSIYCGPSASYIRCVHEQHRFYKKDLYWYIYIKSSRRIHHSLRGCDTHHTHYMLHQDYRPSTN